jgi:hypothetical protein
MSVPVTTLTFLRDFTSIGSVDEMKSDLRHQLATVPGCENVELESEGGTCVRAIVHARNEDHAKGLRAAIRGRIAGWSLLEEEAVGIPANA